MLALITDRRFNQVCIQEDMKAVNRWLRDLDYLVVIGQDLQVEGIITAKDAQRSRKGCIVDFNIKKPKININESIFYVWKMMNSSGSDFLPVYDKDAFVGVISLKTIVSKLIDMLHEHCVIHRQMVENLSGPIVNLQGLVNILWNTTLCEDSKQALNYCNESCSKAIKVIRECKKLNITFDSRL